MFYKLSKGAELVENFNVPAGKDGKALFGKDADAAALEQAKKVGADSVKTSDGRVVL